MSVVLVRRASKRTHQLTTGSYWRPRSDRVFALALLPPLVAIIAFAATTITTNTLEAILIMSVGALLFWRYLGIARYEIRMQGDGILIQSALRQRFIKFEHIAGYYKDPHSIVLTLNPRQKVLLNRPLFGFDTVLALRCSRRIRLGNPIVGFDDLHRSLVRARFMEPDEPSSGK
jgi:hypothetical protein